MAGVYVETENGEVCACSVQVEITGIVHDEERGRKYYAARLGEPLSTELLVPTGRGSAGIARAAAEAGAWVNTKLLVQYLDGWLAENWVALPVVPRRPGEESDDDPEAISAYEQFLLWVDANITAFDSEQWGRVEEGNPERRILVYPHVLGAFFQKLGVRQSSERKAILRYWKKLGWLRTYDEKFSVSLRDVEGKQRRYYQIIEKVES